MKAKLKEIVREILKDRVITELNESVLNERSINAIRKAQDTNLSDIEKALDFYKKNKTTDKKEAFIKVLKKLGDDKKKLAKELDARVSGMYKDAEYKESVNEVKKYNFKKDALTDYFKGKLTAKELDKISKDTFGVSIATKKELQGFLTNKFTQDVMSDTYGTIKHKVT